MKKLLICSLCVFISLLTSLSAQNSQVKEAEKKPGEAALQSMQAAKKSSWQKTALITGLFLVTGVTVALVATQNINH